MNTAIQNISLKGMILSAMVLFMFRIDAQTPYFRHITSSMAFEGAQFHCMYQDRDGYIWMGTDAGPFRYDGMDFRPFSPPDSLISKSVTAIFQDYRKTMWFGFESGEIASYDRHHKWNLIQTDSVPQRRITGFCETERKNLWIGTYGNGFYSIKNNTLDRLSDNPVLTDNYIYSIQKDTAGKVWAGTDDGIIILSPNNENLSVSKIKVEDGLPDFIIQSLASDRDGNIWIGMHEYGICYFDSQTQKIRIPEALKNWPYGSVNDVLVVGNRLWIATENRGLVEYNMQSGKLINYEFVNDMNISRLKLLMPDQEGNVWVITGNDIFLSFGDRIEFIQESNGIPIKEIHALIIGQNMNLWFANDRGLFSYSLNESDDKKKLKHHGIGLDLQHQKIVSLYQDKYGFIWVGTFGQGVIRFDPVTCEQRNFTEKNGLVNGNVLSIQGNDKAIWFATLGGASRCRISDNLKDLSSDPVFENFGAKEGLINNYIYDIHIDARGRVWFATDGSGLMVYENNSFKAVGQNTQFGNKIVYSVTGDTLNNVWLIVAREGLYKFDGKNATKYLDDAEHRNSSFDGILVNRENELVISYDAGIDVLHIETGSVMHFEGNAGLDNIKPDLNTLALDADDNTWIGTAKFIVRYNPGNPDNISKPVTLINNVSVYLEAIDTSQSHIFNHSQNHFSFDYSGLWYQYPEKVFYLVKLEGHDIDWIVTKNNNVIYSNLTPGRYTFKVKSGLYGNFEGAAVASYTFTIRKPFWLTWWFFTFAGIVLAILIFSYVKFREKIIRRKQEALREKIKFQFENLKSQINPHFLFNSFSTLIALIETTPDVAIEYVNELSALFRNVLEYKDKNLIGLKEEFGIVDNFARLQKMRFGDNLVLNIDEFEQIDRHKIPPLTLQLLIENAIKHNTVSKQKPLVIKIYYDKETNYLLVENNLQPKKDVGSSMGIGIENIISRYRILTNRRIEIQKTEKIFKIGIPLM